MTNRLLRPIRLLGLAALLLSACGTGPIDAVGLSPGGLSQELVDHWSFDEGGRVEKFHKKYAKKAEAAPAIAPVTDAQ